MIKLISFLIGTAFAKARSISPHKKKTSTGNPRLTLLMDPACPVCN